MGQLIVKMPEEPPQVSDPALGVYLRDLHAVVKSLHQSAVPPNAPTNLTITPIAGGNVIQFTRSNAASYALYMADRADRSSATQVNLGTSNIYADNVGQGGIKRWYWLVGLSQSGAQSAALGPRSATTLALGTPAANLPKVPASYAQVFDTTLNRNRPVIPTTDPNVSGQPNAPVE